MQILAHHATAHQAGREEIQPVERCMMSIKQKGTVLVFKQGVTEAEIFRALLDAREILDPHYHRQGQPRIATFDPDDGMPVWYVP
jgi:hypothetical protein